MRRKLFNLSEAGFELHLRRKLANFNEAGFELHLRRKLVIFSEAGFELRLTPKLEMLTLVRPGFEKNGSVPRALCGPLN